MDCVEANVSIAIRGRTLERKYSRPVCERSMALATWTVQLITLLGVMLGALASFVSTRILDRSRWQREEKLRWDTKRLDCYSEFSAAIMRYINIGYRMSAGLGLPTYVEPLEADAGAPALAATESDLSLYWAQLLILAVQKLSQPRRNGGARPGNWSHSRGATVKIVPSSRRLHS
jgi:hypothetical protein